MASKKLTIKKISQSDFNSLTSYTPNTIYLVKDDNVTSNMYIYVSTDETTPTVKKVSNPITDLVKPTISMSSITNIGSTSLTFNGTISSLGDYTTGTVYRFVYGIDSFLDRVTPWIQVISTGNVSYTPTTLIPGSNYSVALEVMDAYGPPVRSAIIQQSTLAAGLFSRGIYFSAKNSSTNAISILNTVGNLVQTENNVGTVRKNLGGASLYNIAMYYGGIDYSNNTKYNKVTSLDNVATLKAIENNIGTARYGLAGANIGDNGVYYGGYDSNYSNKLTIINSLQSLVKAENTVGTARNNIAGATVGSNGIYYGGYTGSYSNKTSIIKSTSELASTESTVGTARDRLAGASVGNNGIYYGGYTGSHSNKVTILNNTASLVQSESTVGTARSELGGASVGTNGIYYAGTTGSNSNTVTILNSTASLVQSESTVGTARYGVTGGSTY